MSEKRTEKRNEVVPGWPQCRMALAGGRLAHLGEEALTLWDTAGWRPLGRTALRSPCAVATLSDGGLVVVDEGGASVLCFPRDRTEPVRLGASIAAPGGRLTQAFGDVTSPQHFWVLSHQGRRLSRYRLVERGALSHADDRIELDVEDRVAVAALRDGTFAWYDRGRLHHVRPDSGRTTSTRLTGIGEVTAVVPGPEPTRVWLGRFDGGAWLVEVEEPDSPVARVDEVGRTYALDADSRTLALLCVEQLPGKPLNWKLRLTGHGGDERLVQPIPPVTLDAREPPYDDLLLGPDWVALAGPAGRFAVWEQGTGKSLVPPR